MAEMGQPGSSNFGFNIQSSEMQTSKSSHNAAMRQRMEDLGVNPQQDYSDPKPIDQMSVEDGIMATSAEKRVNIHKPQ